jgi:sugar lactone lactonase YvrE
VTVRRASGLPLWRGTNGTTPPQELRTNGLAIASDGGLIAADASGRRIVRLRERSSINGSKMSALAIDTVLADSYGGRPLHGPNDLAIRADGSVLFTDFWLANYGCRSHGVWVRNESGTGSCNLSWPVGVYSVAVRQASLFVASAGNEVRHDYAISPCMRCFNPSDAANGIALSPDENQVYLAMTKRGCIVRYDLGGGRGSNGGGCTMHSRRVVMRAAPGEFFDGIAMHSDGNLYAATWRSYLRVLNTHSGYVCADCVVPEQRLRALL